jgi:DNA modification methylase
MNFRGGLLLEFDNIYNLDCLEGLGKIDDNSIDMICSDPPYSLSSIKDRLGKENSAMAQFGKDGSFQRLSKGFMGKEYDGPQDMINDAKSELLDEIIGLANDAEAKDEKLRNSSAWHEFCVKISKLL